MHLSHSALLSVRIAAQTGTNRRSSSLGDEQTSSVISAGSRALGFPTNGPMGMDAAGDSYFSKKSSSGDAQDKGMARTSALIVEPAFRSRWPPTNCKCIKEYGPSLKNCYGLTHCMFGS